MSSGDGLVKRRVVASSRNNDDDDAGHCHRSSAANSSLSSQHHSSSAALAAAGNAHSLSDDEPDLFEHEPIGGAGTKSADSRLTLMEEVFLLGLKDKQGYTSFWNEHISIGLRGCILAELFLRKRIALERAGSSAQRTASLPSRRVVVLSTEHTGDALLDEALQHIQETHPPETLHSWVLYMTGETWNPYNLKYQLKNVRERIAKSLVEKGVLTTEKKNFFIFDMTTHPLVNCPIKNRLILKLQETFLASWTSNPHKLQRRLLALVILAWQSDVIENAFLTLSDQEYETVMGRVRSLIDLDFEAEARKSVRNESIWAVFSAVAR